MHPHSTLLKYIFPKHKNIRLFFIFSLLLQMPLSVWGKNPVKDGSTPTNITRTNNITDITGGIRPKNGGNLFHSFTNFSIKSGETVRFVHAQGIDNIINRVTGSSASNIDGTIQTLIDGTNNQGDANLFLVNPRGIIFGKDANLDIGGSFVGSTADSIKFLDGSEFSATNPSSEPILTISAPVGLQYGANPGKIQVQGTGNNLDISEGFLNTRNRTAGLQVADGKSLVLIGGDIQLNGGNLTAKSGRVDLLSVNNSEVSLVNSNGQIKPEPTQGINYGNIELINAASVDTSGISAGDIQVQGKNVFLKDGSALVTNTTGNGVDGILNVKATELFQVSGISASGKMVSSLYADVAPGATGSGGRININTKGLLINDGGLISSGTSGFGNAGTLIVKAEDIQLIGISPPGVNGFSLGPSGLISIVAPGATGNSGDLSIETGSLRVADGAVITTNTLGVGNAGNLNIKAKNVEVTGGSNRSTSNISASVSKSSGKGGNVLIETGKLRLINGGQITTITTGTGEAGNTDIRANSVELVGSKFLKLLNQSRNSGLFANAVKKDGQGGDLSVTADRIILRDGATIDASNFFPNDSENLRGFAGTGSAGNININSPFILLENQATITANTNAGDKGNINIQSQNLQLRQGSAISTNARNSSNGGNITIATDTLTALENSDITANAQQGFGGRVSISAQGIFGTEVRNQLTSGSDITASSDLGIQFSGIVEINGVVIDPVSGLANLKSDVVDASKLIPPSCVAQYRDNKFYLVGRGGHPVAPSDVLGSDTVLVDLGQVTGDAPVQIASLSLPRNTQSSQNLSRSENSAPMVEAQGWVISAEGKVTLTANLPTAKVQNPWMKNPQCGSVN